jgi:hypothetical protein
MGPAGAYVVGLDFAITNLVGSFLGISHGTPFQTVAVDLQVNDDGTWTDYDVQLCGRFTGGCCGVLDLRVFVRDARGRQHAELWANQSVWAV